MFSENLPVFDVDLAFALLQMSAIIYERFVSTLFLRVDGIRDTDLLGFAGNIYDAAVSRMIVEGRHVPSSPFLLHDPRYEALKNTVVKCLFGADKKLVDQAAKWGLKFMAVSDLNGCKVGQHSYINLTSGTVWRIILV